jgi:hypothetical protein
VKSGEREGVIDKLCNIETNTEEEREEKEFK